MYYFRLATVLFSTGLFKSAFSTYCFGETSSSSVCVLVFRVYVPLGFEFNVFSKTLYNIVLSGNIINHMLFNFVVNLFKRSVKI